MRIFESFSPSASNPTGRMTAAATSGPGQGAAPGLVHPGDAHEALGVEAALVVVDRAEHAGHAVTLSQERGDGSVCWSDGRLGLDQPSSSSPEGALGVRAATGSRSSLMRAARPRRSRR